MVEQLQQLNTTLQEKMHSNNGIFSEELAHKNKVALSSLIKHITPSLSDDKVIRIIFC